METKSKPPPPPKPKSLSSQASAGPAPRRNKRGLGWPWNEPATHFSLYQAYITSGKITWLFNWEVWVPDSLPQQVEWIPCVRTPANVKDVDPFLSDIIHNRAFKTSALLGFNEPEIPEQANMTVEQAVELWRQVVLPAKAKFGFRLGSPGMSSDVGRSKPWLNSFLSQLAGQDGIAFLVVHWYGLLFKDMRVFLEDMRATYGLPVWVNEFACTRMGDGEASVPEVEAFIREALPWLDACPWIERYAYFGNHDVGHWVGRASNFTESSGAQDRRLTSVGTLYCEL
ncbi:uncharacterized protein A1O9_03359 [Exophiala aquamarina CBS 119918]|uniref:Asl1-like glycosyl hydrolase catalytic domain-containing protein n=1 Tax=Exophiala aquamarina CBS 119918 TaxID=1182545 RepID=A0A072PP02_9EURO|nr:uncharacterized protein A1O9_03359 [Exophiala aquamarina CBS 119918]KEF61789.1 hypothetical protein A1O9_03359 [Exophiala aquamarina CBS 119918]